MSRGRERRWRGNRLVDGPARAAAPITAYFVLFLGFTASFFYSTRHGKFLEWERILDRTLACRGLQPANRFSTPP